MKKNKTRETSNSRKGGKKNVRKHILYKLKKKDTYTKAWSKNKKNKNGQLLGLDKPTISAYDSLLPSLNITICPSLTLTKKH